MRNKLLLLLAVFVLGIGLGGCGKDPALTKFKTQIDQFCTQVSELDTAINSIDAESDTAPDDLLNCLDQLDAAFKVLAEITVPQEFSYVEQVADKASADMTQAVALYHEAFSNDSYNEYTAEYAKEYYERAYKYVHVIIELLRGETPDMEGVIISTKPDEDTDASSQTQPATPDTEPAVPETASDGN